jgi:glutathione S-transferase
MARPIVYGPAGSTCVWSVRLALTEKGVTHELAEVPFGARCEAEYLARQPFAKFPAFEHDGFALYETQAIVRYVDERFAGAPLQPEDVHEWSRMNQLIGLVDAYARPSIGGVILYNRILMPRLGGAADEADVAAAMPQAKLCLAEIDRLSADHPFLTGAHVCLADLIILPLLYHLGNVPEGPPLLSEHPKLQDWVRRMATRQSFLVTKPAGA